MQGNSGNFFIPAILRNKGAQGVRLQVLRGMQYLRAKAAQEFAVACICRQAAQGGQQGTFVRFQAPQCFSVHILCQIGSPLYQGTVVPLLTCCLLYFCADIGITHNVRLFYLVKRSHASSNYGLLCQWA